MQCAVGKQRKTWNSILLELDIFTFFLINWPALVYIWEPLFITGGMGPFTLSARL